MKATVHISLSDTISVIDNRIYSSFIEHMGRAVYTGIYEPGHPEADEQGFRKDVLELIRPLQLSCIRYPGGNFVSGYRWEDGVGDKASRPVRRDLAWFALEPNEVGTNEFMDFCKKADTSPMMAVNLGTRGPQDAANLLEYCNIPSGSYYSDLRRSHGWEEPHGIKLWCLGNEMDGPWQICGKTAEEYGRCAKETAKMMKWMDPSIELVICGSSYREMPTYGTWERTVLRHCYEHVDYLSLHQYYTDYEDDIPAFLARNIEMDSFIKEVVGICEEIRQEKNTDKKIYLSFDEWNVWYHFQKGLKEGKKEPEKWITPRAIEEEEFDFADALLVGSMLNTLINNSDNVKIACMAQLVNVIAPIMTLPGGKSYVQTIYYPFLYASACGRGTALRLKTDCGSYACSVSDNVPYLDTSAVLSEDGKTLTLFLIHKNLEESVDCELKLLDGAFSPERFLSMTSPSLRDGNTAENSPVKPVERTDLPKAENGCITVSLQPASWNMIQLKRK